MSRTDVHAPYWVKKLQPEWRAFFVEWHNHTKHDCNFSIKNENYRDCLLGSVNRGKNIFCGCSMCTGQVWRRLSNRSERYKAKRLLLDQRWDEVTGKSRWRY